MNKEDLYQKYPKILPNKVISVGDGWLDLLDKLFSYIQGNTDANTYHYPANDKHEEINRIIPQFQATQIKEKMGGMRLYYSYDYFNLTKEQIEKDKWFTDKFSGAVDFTEYMTDSICEKCGEKGLLRDDGWIKCLCDKHAEGRKPL